jgi:hypothetical protein
MDVQPIVLEGRVARLEPLAMSHAEDLAVAATPEIFTNTFPAPEYSPAGMQAVIGYLGSLKAPCAKAFCAGT